MCKMPRNDNLKVNLQAAVNLSVASNLSAYLSCASLDGPLPPPSIFLQPWARNEKNNTRSEISQVIHALGAEKDDANRCVLVNVCWLEGILSRGGTCSKETAIMQGEQEPPSDERTHEPTSENCDEPDDDIFYDSIEPDPMQQSETPSPSTAHPLNKINRPMQLKLQILKGHA